MTEAVVWRLLTRGTLFVVGVLIVVWALTQLQTLVFQVFLALIMACAVDPLVVRVQPLVQALIRKHKLGRGPIVIVIFVLGALIVVLITLEVVSVALADVDQMTSSMAQNGTALQERVNSVSAQLGLPAAVPAAVVQQAQLGLDRIAAILGAVLGLFGGLLNVVFTIIIAIYLASDNDRILASMVSLVPGPNRLRVDNTLRNTGKRLGRWVFAQFAVATIISLLFAVGLTVIGVPYVGLLSLIAFAGEFVPLIGPFISSIPAILVAFATTTPQQGIATAVFCLIVEQLENDLIVPRIMSTATTVHPLVILLAIIAGGTLFGPFGALLAVPFATCVGIILTTLQAEAETADPTG
jgi:predicted PurR-regulated permease PerM